MSPRRIQGCKVILCTLSMLSNGSISRFISRIPVQTLVVDEASQIEIGDYFSVLNSFHSTLRKLCFIGDDRQRKMILYMLLLVLKLVVVPPYGQEDLGDLKSIFEVSHLRTQVLFLDTQCDLFLHLCIIC